MYKYNDVQKFFVANFKFMHIDSDVFLLTFKAIIKLK